MKKPSKRLLSVLPDSSSGSMIETRLRGIPFVFEDDKEFEDGIVIPVLGDNPVSAGRGEEIAIVGCVQAMVPGRRGECKKSSFFEKIM